MELLEFGYRIGAALLAGLLIGIEREIHNKNAGLKTNALVSLGAAVFVLTSLAFAGDDYVDTTRVIGQVVTGIGFLGAGVILHKGNVVRGLTTAATVWCSAGAGCLAAIGQYSELLLLVGVIVFVNVVFNPVDRFIARLFGHRDDEKIDD
ncbi:MgtC/SapB family protein [Salinimicrobium sp. TH3]|uniref:MgtC/SapB family protein n=1 Tax=Salinimicrobium sp. TH3 TaxID=2997342 RepID=UPI0022723CC7|nr:MgtC/SapB family protein [Salinimicrobium sp. TH3]MCY2686278.1 MgtC/SapB family protein [Salinimicrobium sp. TH3]